MDLSLVVIRVPILKGALLRLLFETTRLAAVFLRPKFLLLLHFLLILHVEEVIIIEVKVLIGLQLLHGF
jgi:hypothetical protein